MADKKKMPRRYIPQPEELDRAFFMACADGTLHLQCCDKCGAYRHPARYYCAKCYSGEWSWVPSPGIGTVASWVTTHKTIDPGWMQDVPYTSVTVELAEGPRIVGSLRGFEPSELKQGLPCKLAGEAKSDTFVFFWVDKVD